MKKASTLKVSAQLRKLTTLQTVKDNDTRWSSVFSMITRFFRIQKELSAIQDLLPLIPTLVEVNILEKCYVSLKQFHEINMMLQKENITVIRVREIFDTVMDDFPELSGHLAADAKIVANPIFERTVLKIAKGRPIRDIERASVRCLLRKPAVGHEDDSLLLVDDTANGASEELTYAQKVELRMKRRRKSCSNEIAAKYINLDVLCGTSVECERLFSIAKNILTDTRKSTSLAVFQAILLLKVNQREWDVYTVGRAMGRSTGERFSVLGGGDGVCVGGEEAADDPDLFYEEDEECQL